MQQRFSTCLGTPVVDLDGDAVGMIGGILLHPDTGRVEGFFVQMPGFLQSQTVFLASSDIRRWGRSVEVRDADAVGPLDEHVRLGHLAADPRRVLGQPMVTEAGVTLGRCRDVQFDTESFQLQWLFPKRPFFRWGVPIPIHAVTEVRPDAVVVRSSVLTESPRETLPELSITSAPTQA